MLFRINRKRLITLTILDIRNLIISLVFVSLASIIIYFLYYHTTNLLTERLQERMISIVSTASTQFDVNDVLSIKSIDDIDTPQFRKIVSQLRSIRDVNNDIQYVYLMRRTQDPLTLEFVADAMSLASKEELDSNKNNIIDENEAPPMPGDLYEINDYPALRDEAFYQPAVDPELQPDQWGLMMAAYAPIFDSTDNAVAIIGADILVNDFNAITKSMLLPFLLFILFLLFLLLLLTVLLIRVYSEKVKNLEEIDRQKDELLGIVSHQLAKPITAIKWTLESLADGDIGELTQDQRESMETMQSMAVDLADLVGMILDVSRVQLGRIKLDPQPLDLNTFLSEIINVIRPATNQKHLSLKLHIPQNLPTVLLDKRYTRMVVENLLTNAVKYTPEHGTVTLTISLQNGKLRCDVTDTGCGIPKAEQGKIFEKMYRASNARNAVEGNGFGLYVAKGAVEAQGGKIGFVSTENKGTTFSVTLPANAPSNATKKAR